MAVQAYFEQPYDDRGRMARISDLGRLRAQTLAQGEEQAALARAGMVQGIVGGIGQTLGDLARLSAEQPQRDAEAAARRRTTNQDEVRRMAGQAGSPEDAARILRGEGLIADAERIEDRALAAADRKDRKEQSGLAAMYERLNAAKTIFGKGAALVAEAERDPSMWPKLQPMVVDLAAQVNPALVELVPGPGDANPQALGQLVASAQQMAADYGKAATALKGIESAAGRTDQLEKLRKNSGALLATATSPEQWDGVRTLLANNGVPDEVLSTFGGFSAENVQKAMSVASGGKAPEGTTEQQHLAAFARAKGKSVGQLTPAEMRAARASWTASSREPERPGAGPGVSQAQRAAAERWKHGQLARLEERFSDGAITEDQLPTEKARIQASYREQLGMPPAHAPGVLNAGAAAPPPAGGSLADLARPAAPLGASPAGAAPMPAQPTDTMRPPAPQPMTPQTPSGGQPMPAPPEIAAALAQAQPGEYELSDGSVWQKLPNGELRQVR